MQDIYQRIRIYMFVNTEYLSLTSRASRRRCWAHLLIYTSWALQLHTSSAAVTRALQPHTGSAAVTQVLQPHGQCGRHTGSHRAVRQSHGQCGSHTDSTAVTRAVRQSHGQCGSHMGSAAVTRAVRQSHGQCSSQTGCVMLHRIYHFDIISQW